MGGEWKPMENEIPLNYRRLEVALQSPERVYRNEAHERYHSWQADPRRETAAKILARGIGAKVVCPCGEEFSAVVQ